ncbi:hypothetical protein EJ06DRAFT_472468 [Trichodelitschia bisporula]|uniref:Nascent polypeptide-associated complex subunit alpha-like UBA domain-containing protein n=1 Tax=Trichodelitschia bisporula TaxID=703511 RepID=A0A6G1I3E0_9PEZI|nr:hypothetical protein EJ06DRAFT_472468 [Trichodelitschia bisporula]
MAEEPQPATITEGADATGDPPLPTNAEDRKAAEALSNLDRADADEDRDVDSEALGQAMKKLDVGGKKAEAASKKVKIEAGDVALLVDQLEMAKGKATELLKAHDGDAVKAMVAYVTVA